MTKPVHFEGLGRCFYQPVEFRAPRKGEFYLSGAIPAAYKAPNDLSTPFHIVKPVARAVLRQAWQPYESLPIA